MNLRLIFLMGLFCTSAMLSSCFDVVEEVNLKTNGSGNIKATVNFSKSKTKVSSLMKLKSIDGINIPSESDIRREVAEVVAILKKTPGISGVKSNLDFTNFIATISCDFTQVSALNAFTKTLSTHFKTKLSSYSTYSYDPGTKSFARNYTYSADAKKEFSKLKAENQKQFQDAFYTYIYRFDNEVKSQNNSQARIAGNKKAVMLKTNIIDLVNNKTNLSNLINLK